MSEDVTEILSSCPICNSGESILIHSQPDAHIPMLQLHECSNCGVIYLSPRLTRNAVEELENASVVYHITDEDAEATVQTLDGVVNWLESHTHGPGKILDVGCNRGFLLEAAQRRGWQAYGIEIASVAADTARQTYGLKIYSSLDELARSTMFDAITIWHTLEHVTKPVEFLAQLKSRLAPDGVLALQVPSFEFMEEFRRRDQLYGLVCSVHNFYYKPESLKMILDRAGLQVLRLVSSQEDLAITALCTGGRNSKWYGRVRYYWNQVKHVFQ